MRPAGEISAALLQALERRAGQGLTMRELAEAAQVGSDAARRTLDNLRRHGRVRIAGQRRVSYRNRPVAEYALPDPRQAPASNAGLFLQRCWG
ncbi:hypothetical protein D8I35_09510 [Corticibacter populi]|uniref:Uncharacterized protein n=1 Tax=Corticibacter populi TaxID=1550736 RepID=A0A3M6QUM1_9BURK|nr:hypothetical protein [Corticibacter populi]RMX06728.1 hypothetical protein D8I35_09510 [Corticibacter populi]RZS31691.1 hypothetical protein EV687_2360 [Corticibacter populi]